MQALADHVAIVTGSSRGIGAATSMRLAADGAKVVVNYQQDVESAHHVVDLIRRAGGTSEAIQADVSNLLDVRRLVDQTMATFGRLDILVNNAGIAEFLPLEKIDEGHFNRLFNLNVLGLVYATQAAAMVMSGRGRIINISSGAAQSAPPGTSLYSATKAAVEAITKSHAAELGSRGITVNAVAPGLTVTDMLNSVIPPIRQQALAAETALGRLGQPNDIADVVAFLASDDARWITGQVVGANGGLR